jgi:PAS domain-containing protein
MLTRISRTATAVRTKPDATGPLARAGLDTLPFGFAIFDAQLALMARNRAFCTLRGYPVAPCRPGTAVIDFYRFNARRGDYGPGDAEAQARWRLDRVLASRTAATQPRGRIVTTPPARRGPAPRGRRAHPAES